MFSIGANADSNYHIDVVTKDMTTGEIYTERVYPTNRPDLPSTRSSNSIIGDMDREPLDDPKDSICYIESTFSDGSGITGTGFVVGNNIVVTAGHVIYDKSGETGYAVKVDVYPGHSAGKGSPFGKFNSTSLHVTNNYAYESTGSDITRAYYDIGIIELGTNIEAKTGSWALEYTGYNFNDVFLNQNFRQPLRGGGKSDQIFRPALAFSCLLPLPAPERSPRYRARQSIPGPLARGSRLPDLFPAFHKLFQK